MEAKELREEIGDNYVKVLELILEEEKRKPRTEKIAEIENLFGTFEFRQKWELLFYMLSGNQATDNISTKRAENFLECWNNTSNWICGDVLIEIEEKVSELFSRARKLYWQTARDRGEES